MNWEFTLPKGTSRYLRIPTLRTWVYLLSHRVWIAAADLSQTLHNWQVLQNLRFSGLCPFCAHLNPGCAHRQAKGISLSLSPPLFQISRYETSPSLPPYSPVFSERKARELPWARRALRKLPQCTAAVCNKTAKCGRGESTATS